MYPENTIAAYQKTYVRQLRTYERTPYRDSEKMRARHSLINKHEKARYSDLKSQANDETMDLE